MKTIKQSDCLDYRYSRRLSLHFGDRLAGIFHAEWDADIVSMDGAHYHIWVPINTTGDELKKLLDDFKYYASHQGDPVSFSWSYKPEESNAT